jgi:precorrin-6A synthase
MAEFLTSGPPTGTGHSGATVPDLHRLPRAIALTAAAYSLATTTGRRGPRPVRKVSIIGIGAGDPEHVTVQAVRALNAVDVFFVVTKGTEQQELVDLRTAVLERYVEEPSYRLVEVRDPERSRGETAAEQRAAVAAWRDARAEQYAALIRDELDEDGHGAFLAWGDPTLYESTLTIVADLAARPDVAFDYDVVPGISAVSALAARHRIPLNRVGGAVQVTTGRRLAGGLPAEADDVVVMLDPGCTFREVAGEDVDIYWGAYLGTPDETLVSGSVTEVADEIERVRAREKERKGWIFDTYLLRRK